MLQKTLEGSLDRTSTSSAILSLHQRLAQAFLHSYLVANHTPQTAFSSFPTAPSSSCCIHRQHYKSSPILERAILDLIIDLENLPASTMRLTTTTLLTLPIATYAFDPATFTAPIIPGYVALTTIFPTETAHATTSQISTSIPHTTTTPPSFQTITTPYHHPAPPSTTSQPPNPHNYIPAPLQSFIASLNNALNPNPHLELRQAPAAPVVPPAAPAAPGVNPAAPAPAVPAAPGIAPAAAPANPGVAPGGGAPPVPQAPQQASPVTTVYIDGVQVVYTQHFSAVPSQGPTPLAGQVGLGTLTGTVGAVRTDQARNAAGEGRRGGVRMGVVLGIMGMVGLWFVG